MLAFLELFAEVTVFDHHSIFLDHEMKQATIFFFNQIANLEVDFSFTLEEILNFHVINRFALVLFIELTFKETRIKNFFQNFP